LIAFIISYTNTYEYLINIYLKYIYRIEKIKKNKK